MMNAIHKKAAINDLSKTRGRCIIVIISHKTSYTCLLINRQIVRRTATRTRTTLNPHSFVRTVRLSHNHTFPFVWLIIYRCRFSCLFLFRESFYFAVLSVAIPSTVHTPHPHTLPILFMQCRVAVSRCWHMLQRR